MRVVLNEAFRAFSGKLSDIQFSDTKYGPVAGRAATLNDPKTPAQTKQRGALGRSSALFGQLDLAHVQMWRDYAKTLRWIDKKSGAKFTPDAIAVYNSLADRWLGANKGQGTPPSAPPTASYAGDPIIVEAILSPGEISFLADGDTSADTVVECWLQKLPKATRKPTKGGYRVVGYTTFGSSHPSLDLPVSGTAYAAQYRFVNKLTGQATELISIPVLGSSLAVEQGGVPERPAAARKKAA